MEKFRPEDTTEPDALAELLEVAEVTDGDRDEAESDWRDDPPDEEFDGVVDAEEVSDE